MARRDDRAYREYVREEPRSQRGCIARRMQRDLHHGLSSPGKAQFPEHVTGDGFEPELFVAVHLLFPREDSGSIWRLVSLSELLA